MPEIMSDATTNGIRVQAESMYIAERSNAEDGYYFFAYRMRISNIGHSTPVQLISRHWVITDANAEAQEVRGPGVVGRQPTLEEGEAFEYTSFCPLPTPVGSMHGTYQMVTADGESFDAKVAPFTLAIPHIIN